MFSSKVIKARIKNGDRVLLCSDGLWSALTDDELSKVLHSGPVSGAVISLLNLADNIAGETGDNMSAIALELSHDASDPSWVSTGTMPLGETTTIIMPPTQQDNPEYALSDADLSDDDIERRIAEIQLALNKTIR